MRRRLPSLFILFCLLPLPTASADSATAMGVQGPDADGAFLLTFDIHRDAAGPVALALDVARTDADGTVTGARDLGTAELAGGTTRREVSFLPTEGAGQYSVWLVVDGARAAEVTFDADDAGASANVAFAVPDEPTYLNLTSDEVNSQGKVKSPGEALITRATLADANGAADVDAVLWRVARADATIDEGALPHAGDPNATSVPIELRYERAPLDAGDYALVMTATKAGASVASASRTFVIREIAPTFVSGALANVTPDENVTQTATVVLADRNGLPNGPLDTRVYRGSARMEGAGFSATLGAPLRLADVDGEGRSSYPLVLTAPAGASAGAYRVSLYSNGSLLAGLPFDVLPLPTLVSVDAATEGARLVLTARGEGDGFATARLTDGNGSATSVTARFTNGTSVLALDAPAPAAAWKWHLTLHAREGGATLASRNGTWSAPMDGPSLRLAPLHARSRLPATWALDAEGGLDGANATFAFTRWDGVAEPALSGALVDGRVRVDAPADLPAGRYTSTVRVVWPNGTASQTSWTFEAGPWVQLELGEPVVDGREARVPLHNTGGLAVSRLVIETAPHAGVSLLADGALHAARGNGTRAVFTGLSLAPGETAELRLALGDGPLRAGQHVVPVRVLARVEVG